MAPHPNPLIVIPWTLVRDVCHQHGLDHTLPLLHQQLVQASQVMSAAYYFRRWKERIAEQRYPSRTGRVLPAMQRNLRILTDALSSPIAHGYPPHVTNDVIADAQHVLQSIQYQASSRTVNGWGGEVTTPHADACGRDGDTMVVPQ
jgi:hypothetical protein